MSEPVKIKAVLGGEEYVSLADYKALQEILQNLVNQWTERDVPSDSVESQRKWSTAIEEAQALLTENS